ncbi:MAG: hypothetical protein A2W95_09410 [Bacteroidetes bacterium GWA2_40_14]|nr:MAG: hypothetical protein A2W95_09410 [Bacteroidetes bacterium GWA2_40_14]HAZ01241.1 SAM-dependent methyltransferase [Marinilabiliales bacterium]
MISYRLLSDYINFLYHSRGKKGFGIHSPFVFQLVTQVVHSSVSSTIFTDIEAQRKLLLKDSTPLDVQDYGAGSQHLKGTNRKVRELAVHSLKPAKQAQLLFRLANHMKSQNILELGTSLGITTCYLAKTGHCSKLVTLEGCPNVAKMAQQTFKKLKLTGVDLVVGEFSQTLPKVLDGFSTLDFVFFDGNHREKPTLEYFEHCLKKKNNQSLFVFDDIHHLPEMKEAWEQIKANPEVTATIDLFHLGLVFFKKELSKQDFMVRF